MIEEEEQIHRIEAWYTGEMSPDEKARFEEDLASDHELRQLFEKHTFFLDGIEGMKVQAFADKMRQTKVPFPLTGNRRSWWASISIAASVIALIGITYFVVQPSGVQRMAREYYSSPLAEVQRSGIPIGDSLYQAGMIAFARKDWDAAISIFGRINPADPDYSRALYFEAHAYAAGKGYKKALALFRDPVFRNGTLQQQAEWNSVLMMMFLQYPGEEIAEALQQMEGNPDHFYSSKAAAILNRLKSD